MPMHEWLRWLMPTPEYPPEVRRPDLDRVDERLTDLESKQAEIKARLLLLERQADPRDIRGVGGD